MGGAGWFFFIINRKITGYTLYWMKKIASQRYIHFSISSLSFSFDLLSEGHYLSLSVANKQHIRITFFSGCLETSYCLCLCFYCSTIYNIIIVVYIYIFSVYLRSYWYKYMLTTATHSTINRHLFNRVVSVYADRGGKFYVFSSLCIFFLFFIFSSFVYSKIKKTFQTEQGE